MASRSAASDGSMPRVRSGRDGASSRSRNERAPGVGDPGGARWTSVRRLREQLEGLRSRVRAGAGEAGVAVDEAVAGGRDAEDGRGGGGMWSRRDELPGRGAVLLDPVARRAPEA